MNMSLTLNPIGYLMSGKQVKFQTRHQPLEAESETHVLELLPNQNFEMALRDLAGFSRIWLVWWFHRNTTWRPLVLPPRGPAQRRGVFATRSPHRPNPIGLTAVRLLGIEGRRMILGPCDLVDRTPILDIKPYIPAYDAFPEAQAGWHDAVDSRMMEPPLYGVTLSDLAQTQQRWLQENWSIDFTPRMKELLSRDPTPHRTRRIRRRQDGRLEIGCGAWRAFFEVEGNSVRVVNLDAAYPLRFLLDPSLDVLPDREAQLAFLERWPETA